MALFVVEEWMDDAECNYSKDKDLFFPETQRYSEKVEEAKKWCWRCPVSDECLEYALRENINHGIFAGLLPDERKRIKRGRNRDVSDCA